MECLLQELLASSASDEDSRISPNSASVLHEPSSTVRTSVNSNRTASYLDVERDFVKKSQESYIAPSLTAVLASGTEANTLGCPPLSPFLSDCVSAIRHRLIR
jgi:hypothetical protein